jgi:hypothetical protein
VTVTVRADSDAGIPEDTVDLTVTEGLKQLGI